MRGLYRHEEMLFALLRASLHRKETETGFFEGASADEWKACYQLACRQGVMALAWDGVMALPDGLLPPKALKITWGMAVEEYEKQYERYCSTVQDLTDVFLRKGIMTVLLKGVGLSNYYPKPCHREGGDIDIYTFSNKPDRMTDAEANRLADKLMEEQGIEVDMHSPKHSNFYFKGIPVENHKTFLNVERYEIAGQADALLRKMMDPQFTYLMDGEHMCMTPPKKFNVLFVAFHAAQHYGAGLALHHLCDWAMVIGRCGDELPRELWDWKLKRFVSALTSLCNRYLGTHGRTDWMGGKFGDEMLGEILEPKFPLKGVKIKGKWNIFKYKTRRFLHNYKLSHQVLDFSAWRWFWSCIKLHLRRPDIIFQVHPK